MEPKAILYFLVAIFLVVMGIGSVIHLSSNAFQLAQYAMLGLVLVLAMIMASIVMAWFKLRMYKRTGVRGTTIGRGKNARILIDPFMDETAFRRTVVHELPHLTKELGYIRRDISSLVEYVRCWENNTLNKAELGIFKKGKAKVSNCKNIGIMMNRLLAELDSAEYENPQTYSISLFITGMIVGLANENNLAVWAYIRELAQGKGNSQAIEALKCCLSLSAIVEKELINEQAVTVQKVLLSWISGYLALYQKNMLDETPLGYFESGKAILAQKSQIRSISDKIDRLPKEIEGFWSPSIEYIAAQLAGLFFEKAGRRFELAMETARRTLERAPLTSLGRHIFTQLAEDE